MTRLPRTKASPRTPAKGGAKPAAAEPQERLPKAVRIVRRRAGAAVWEVLRPDAKQPSATAATLAEAQARARELLVNVGGGQLVLKDDGGVTLSVERVAPRPRRT